MKQNFPRTQNNVEAWHRPLKVKQNAGVYELIKNLRMEMLVAQTAIEKIQAVELPPINKKLENKKNSGKT